MNFLALRCLLLLSMPVFVFAQDHELKGVIIDQKNGETLTGVVLVLNGTSFHAVTDLDGKFSIKAPAGSYTLNIRYTGYSQINLSVKVPGQPLSVKMESAKTQLKEVVVKANADNQGFTQDKGLQAGVIQLSAQQIKALPSLAGEQDVIKAIQLMPGVKKGTDGGSTMLVRGGNNDQNLFLLDEAVIYNPAHALSLFSVFNTDALQEVKLIKGPFGAPYHGRLSSVMELKTKQGNAQKKRIEGTLSSLSARLTADGPLLKGKLTYMVSARRSYLDQTLKLANLNIPYHFTDVNSKLCWNINEQNKLTMSVYAGNDVLSPDKWTTTKSNELLTSAETHFTNRAFSLQWIASRKSLMQTISLVHSAYAYAIGGSFSGNTVDASSGIQDWGLKARWHKTINSRLGWQWGISANRHSFQQTKLTTRGELITSGTSLIPAQTNYEAAAYTALLIRLNSKWELNPGITLSGAANGNTLYFNPEPRLMVSYAPNEYTTIKGGYSRMVQYMHMIAYSSFALPTDIWYPANNFLKPSTSDQLSLGWFRTHKNWNLSAEAYYKRMHQICEFAEGKGIQFKIPLPQEISQGKGTSWGGEWMIQTHQKKWNAWIAYTLAWSTRQFDSVNNGKVYYARYDRRHDVSSSVSYKLKKNWNVCAVWTYATGARFTPQTGSYYVLKPGGGGVQQVPVYGSTNSAKFKSSHRLDINFTYQKSKRSEWQIGAYNAYNRAQPYKVSVHTNADGRYTYRQSGLLGFTPYISYHFTF